MYLIHGYLQMTAPFVPMTKAAVAAVLDCTTRTIEIMMKSGEIPAPVRIAGHVFWHPEVFYSWLDNALRGHSAEALSEVLPMSVPKTETNILKVGTLSKSSGKGDDPASRMKARQALRLGISDVCE
jgi:hypothetical protein